MRLELYDYFRENDDKFPRTVLIAQAKKQGYSDFDINEVAVAIATGKIPSQEQTTAATSASSGSEAQTATPAGPSQPSGPAASSIPASAASNPSGGVMSPVAAPADQPGSKDKTMPNDLFTSSPSETGLETVIDTIASTKWGNDTYEMFFTQKRIIVAKLGNTFWWYFWLGFIGQLIAWSAAEKRRKQLKELTPDSILKSDPKNVEFPYVQVIKATLKKPGFLSPATLELESSTWKKYTLPDRKSYEKALNLCRQYIGGILKVK
jgi:hypothetical protein